MHSEENSQSKRYVFRPKIKSIQEPILESIRTDYFAFDERSKAYWSNKKSMVALAIRKEFTNFLLARKINDFNELTDNEKREFQKLRQAIIDEINKKPDIPGDKNKKLLINEIDSIMISYGLKPLLDKIKLDASHKEIASAEKRIANGIKEIFSNYQPKESDYDAQGIYTKKLTKKELDEANITQYFPEPHHEGIIVHFYREDHKHNPPLRYMLEQRINSIYAAAKETFKKNELPDNLLAKLDEEKEKLEKTVEEKLKADGFLSRLSTDDFHIAAEKMMADYTSQALINVYEIYKQEQKKQNKTHQHFEKFSETVIKEAIAIRPPYSALTFDQGQDKFSYDHLVNTTTAHDRKKEGKLANPSMVFEGTFQEKGNEVKCKINNFILKHSSLPPISDIKGIHTKETDIDILLSTCRHIEEVAKTMAALRRHGGAKGPIEIDWTYQLLTSNFFNKDKQASTYGYIVNAINLMSQAELDNGNIHLTAHVFNAGINRAGDYDRLGDWDIGQKTRTQRRENRKAYLHFNENHKAFISDANIQFKGYGLELMANLPDNDPRKAIPGKIYISPDDGTYVVFVSKYGMAQRGTLKNIDLKDLSNRLDDGELKERILEVTSEKGHTPDVKPLLKIYETLNTDQAKLNQEEYRKLMIEQAANTKLFNQYRATYENASSTPEKRINLQKAIAATINKSIEINERMSHITYQIEKEQKAQWKQHELEINELVKKLPNLMIGLDPDKDADADKIITLSALSIKSYMDKLYYSGDYRKPEMAAVFNAYMGVYQHLIGMTASIGCKSANDRTYVARLLMTALAGDLNQKALPPDLATADKTAYKKLQDDLKIIAMTNSAIHSAITDTGGGTPKAKGSKSQYQVLGDINVSEFGKYASHFVEKDMGFYKKAYQVHRNQKNKNVNTTSQILSTMGKSSLNVVPNQIYLPLPGSGINPLNKNQDKLDKELNNEQTVSTSSTWERSKQERPSNKSSVTIGSTREKTTNNKPTVAIDSNREKEKLLDTKPTIVIGRRKI